MIDIQELTLEEIMGDRFGRYSKYIIQDRALPDIRDGLKPVQRRILFAMFQEGNTSTHNFRKSAKTVGNVIGNYHPHGDTSVYEAMVRMSQNWKNREVLIEMHGNNGSMDGDPAAAMRYTEARLSKIADELLRDLDKDTVEYMLNFDDTAEEPIVLPAGYPNLLVNGATGISAGYATEIPTHNLGEVINATIYYIDHPDASVDDIMKKIPGPDFPTGGIIQGKDGLKQAYTTGRGKVVVRSQTRIEDLRGGRQQIVISEIPFDVNKATLVRRMDELRLNRSVDGIMEVRDESDRDGLQIVVELKKDANADAILQFFYKNSDLQVNYNFNMVAINHQRPDQVGILPILEAYVTHRAEIIRKRTQFELDKASRRLHIVDGLIKAVSILDEVIAAIRDSKDKRDAKANIIKRFNFSEEQAEAIVTLQLYRLTNTDITTLQNERLELNENIAQYQAILNDKKILMNVMKRELKSIGKAYSSPRRTRIEAEIEEIVIEKQYLLPDEDVMTVITRGGYIKRTSLRSFKSSAFEELGLRAGDHVLYMAQHSTLENLILFTNKGNYVYQPVYELQELRWKEMGEHISQRIPFASDEQIIAVYPYDEKNSSQLILTSREGMIKQTEMAQFKPFRGHKNKSGIAMSLAAGHDEVVSIHHIDNKVNQKEAQVMIFTAFGFALRFVIDEINNVGARAKGVRAVNLKAGDHVVNAILEAAPEDNTQVILFTQRGNMKRMRWDQISLLGRAKRGLMSLKELKTNPHRLVDAYPVITTKQAFEIYSNKGHLETITAGDITIANRYGNGSAVLNEDEFGQILSVTPLSDFTQFKENKLG